jgi:hypothetical protein
MDPSISESIKGRHTTAYEVALRQRSASWIDLPSNRQAEETHGLPQSSAARTGRFGQPPFRLPNCINFSIF